MAWVRIDDQAPLNRKFLKAGPAASWLWVCGLAHCQAKLTDGFIADELLPMIGVKQGYGKLAKWLVNAGLWERVEDGYRVHDYHDFNPTKAAVLERRAEDSKRKSSGFRKDSKPLPNVPSVPIPSSLPKEQEVKPRTRDNGAAHVDDRLRIPDWLDDDLARMHPTADRIGFYVSLSREIGSTPMDQSDPKTFGTFVKQKFCEFFNIDPPELKARGILAVRAQGAGNAEALIRTLGGGKHGA